MCRSKQKLYDYPQSGATYLIVYVFKMLHHFTTAKTLVETDFHNMPNLITLLTFSAIKYSSE